MTTALVDRRTEHFRRLCLDKHAALTTKGGHWPKDGSLWTAGSPAAAEQIADMLRTYAKDVPPDESFATPRQRIWPSDIAVELITDLGNRAIACRLYDTRYIPPLLGLVQQITAWSHP